MTRHLLFVLLLATGFALANDRPAPKRATSAAKPQAKTEAAQGREQHAHAQLNKDAKAQTAKEAKAETDQASKVQTDKDAQAQASKDTQAQTDNNAQPQTNAQTGEETKLLSVPG